MGGQNLVDDKGCLHDYVMNCDPENVTLSFGFLIYCVSEDSHNCQPRKATWLTSKEREKLLKGYLAVSQI